MKITFLLAPALLFGLFCSAQTTPAQAQQHHHLMKELNLSKSQKAEIKTIRQDSKNKKQSITGNAALSPSEKKQQLKALRYETRKQFVTHLSPEQKEKMKTLRAEHADRPVKNRLSTEKSSA